MDLCTDKKLIEKALPFFKDDPNRLKILVTPDGQFFNKLSDCTAYCSFHNFSPFLITREMLEKKEAKTEKKTAKKGKIKKIKDYVKNSI